MLLLVGRTSSITRQCARIFLTFRDCDELSVPQNMSAFQGNRDLCIQASQKDRSGWKETNRRMFSCVVGASTQHASAEDSDVPELYRDKPVHMGFFVC